MIKEILHDKIPYYSQWISSDLVGDIIQGKLEATEDPLWELSGANTPIEYEFWAKNICGMACLKMILEYCNIKSDPLIDLAKDCAEYGGYKVHTEEIDGLFYLPFTNYIKERFDLDALTVSPLNTNEITNELLKGNLYIVSVHCQIRNPDIMYSGKKGGHLVLVSGVDIPNNCFYINNPSGDNITTQKDFKIQIPLFEKYFAGRGILINLNC